MNFALNMWQDSYACQEIFTRWQIRREAFKYNIWTTFSADISRLNEELRMLTIS